MLVLVPWDPEVFSYIAWSSALTLAANGIDPRECDIDVDALGVAESVDALLGCTSGSGHAAA